jgi:flagellar assembly factor FliW
MKVLTDPSPFDTDTLAANAFALPRGIAGFPDYTRAELLYRTEEFPLLWMKLIGPRGFINYVVMEPGGIIPDYEPELFDSDAAALDLTDPAEAMVLTILTVRRKVPVEATVNLVGPIIVNRRTRIGRQFVIANYSRYQARHPLIAPAVAESSAVSA